MIASLSSETSFSSYFSTISILLDSSSPNVSHRTLARVSHFFSLASNLKKPDLWLVGINFINLHVKETFVSRLGESWVVAPPYGLEP